MLYCTIESIFITARVKGNSEERKIGILLAPVTAILSFLKRRRKKEKKKEEDVIGPLPVLVNTASVT